MWCVPVSGNGFFAFENKFLLSTSFIYFIIFAVSGNKSETENGIWGGQCSQPSPVSLQRPHKANAEEMTKYHSDDYIKFLRSIRPDNMSEYSKQMQRFNVGEDCPVFDGLFEFCQLSAGGSVASAVKLNKQQTDIAVNWAGGLHHAKKSEASGFCYVNDIVLAILELLK